MKNNKYNFTAIIKASGIGRGGAYVEFPYDVEKEFGAGRIKVHCSFENEEYRGSLVRMGTKCHIIGITKEIRNRLGKDIGDSVNVILRHDTQARTVDIPGELYNKLNQKNLFEKFGSLSYTRRKEMVRAVETAQKTETKEKRIKKVIRELEK